MREAVFRHGFAAASRAARIRSRAAIRAGAIPAADRDDLIQELLIACWLASDKFDPSKASQRTFLECVITSRLASAIRTARRRPAMVPLDSVAKFASAPLAMTLDLSLDVARVLDRLDAGDRQVAAALMEHSPTEACRELGMARSTVYQRIGRLRARFVAVGITAGCTARIRC